VSELASAVRKKERRRVCKLGRPVREVVRVRIVWVKAWRGLRLGVGEKAWAYVGGWDGWEVRRGPVSSFSDLGGVCGEDGCVGSAAGRALMVGIAKKSKAMLTQNGDQRL
jgi:hypothetical protein